MSLLGQIFRVVLDLVEAAFEGDEDALERLSAILPDELNTDLVAAVEDRRDADKFGPR